MRGAVTLLGETYGYDLGLCFIVKEKGNGRSIQFANTKMETCWQRLFNLAYPKGIYIVGGEDDENDESYVDRLIHNKIPFFVGDGVYDLDTDKPIFLLWWNSFIYQGELFKLMSIDEAFLLYNNFELKDIFQKLSQVADIQINGNMGFGSCEQILIKLGDCWEQGYNEDFYLLIYADDGKPCPRRN